VARYSKELSFGADKPNSVRRGINAA